MKILVIEDEKLLAESIRAVLEQKGFEVETVYDGETGAEYALTGIYDLLILDVMMPKLDGLQVARQVRAQRCSTPILMLSARSAVEDRIMGLNAGADYYLTKPFDSGELLASINALLRRQGDQVDQLTFGDLSLDLSTGILLCGGNSIRLSAREFDVMRLLLQAGKRSVGNDEYRHDYHTRIDGGTNPVGSLKPSDGRIADAFPIKGEEQEQNQSADGSYGYPFVRGSRCRSFCSFVLHGRCSRRHPYRFSVGCTQVFVLEHLEHGCPNQHPYTR